MAARSLFSGSGSSDLRSATPTAVDIKHDTADHKLKYKDDAGTTQVVLTEAASATLTNKTLTSPTIASPTITGTTSIGNGATLTTPVINNPAIDTIKGNASTATVSAGYSSDTYLAGSSIGIPTSGFLAKARYSCKFDMVKTAAGTATFVVVVRIGTAGTTADSAILTFTFTAGTAAVDTGMFEVVCHFRTVGSGTSAVLVGVAELRHALAATGLTTLGASGQAQIAVVSSGFDSTIAATIIGISVNGGASFSGTNTLVQAELRSF
jgi:hypothetical protein